MAECRGPLFLLLKNIKFVVRVPVNIFVFTNAAEYERHQYLLRHFRQIEMLLNLIL